MLMVMMMMIIRLMNIEDDDDDVDDDDHHHHHDIGHGDGNGDHGGVGGDDFQSYAHETREQYNPGGFEPRLVGYSLATASSLIQDFYHGDNIDTITILVGRYRYT